MRIRRLVLLAALAIVIALGALAIRWSNGFSARSQPTAAERMLARAARRWTIPRRFRDSKNPVPFSSEVWADARAHFADHCGICHANDGSGQTEIGRNLSPRVPDIRLADTQNLSDGELYWIIENGVRLTGMPAWGHGRDDEADTWKLVHFIRRLKDLTPEQLKEMESLNPKTPAERQEEQQDDQFLSGKDIGPSQSGSTTHQHKE